jgi:hypothetical protein
MQPAQPSPSPGPAPRPYGVMLRLTLSALERASHDPSLWREAEVHRAVLVSGLSVLINGLALLQRDLD